ncbi:hypothetical protein SORBI_3003G116000 [Sorghum bicolor]|uniref:Uncharacterized protein n=1 Tax=Sorghum bicolor TaxID=4558 RepID=C5XFU2_SORBI|nr:hypothetical protein SORBI_3003G116000 [Sorghum bicolor]
MAKIKPKALLAQSKVKKAPSQISVTTIVTYMILGILVVSSVYVAYKYLKRQRNPWRQWASRGINTSTM